MGFNYAIEKAKFEREWTQLRVEYEKAGMSNEKINILHDYDWENFKKERIYAIHTQEFREAQYDNGNSQEDKSPLFKKFLSAISRWDNYAASTSTGWIEDITDERLAARLKELSQEDLELLTQFIIQGFTQSDLEQMGYGKQYKISRRISRLKNFLKKFLPEPNIGHYPFGTMDEREIEISSMCWWKGKEVNSYGEIFFQ